MKYVLGILGFIILGVIAVVLLASTTGNRTTNTQEGEKVVNLADYVTDGTVDFTTDGKIVGSEEHRAIRITVTPTFRRVQILEGYDGQVVKQRKFDNTQAAFDAFMRSLSTAGYTRVRKTDVTEVKGACPLGRRFIYDLNGPEQDLSLWSTSCSTRSGTYGGDSNMTRRLFQNQIPDYFRYIRGVQL